MSKSTWADVSKGDSVELKGNVFRVEKIKRDGKKRAAVKVSRGGRTYPATVKLADRVKIVPDPVTDESGAQRRWARKAELAAVLDKPKPLPAGDGSKTKPPSRPKGDLWDRPIDRVERMMGDLLTARLVGETKNESEGYYVPPVDVSTVAAHLALFHGGIPDTAEDEGTMLAEHALQHRNAESGVPLAVNHWHTAKRP